MGQQIDDRVERVRVRRAPKFMVFLLAGAALGIITAMILTFAFTGTDQASPNTGLMYTAGQVFGFLVLAGIVVGGALGAVIALILDRRSSRRTREVIVDHLTVHPED